ncbi:DEAD/DEAH box helicase [Phocaeicola paurosaccharolyticus]|jgi:superfamily II DNA/RNA helicase|uniref:DEAD/DEAH box helicase n=1 Tax=Phocaeicola paurosaccharolyticus TaxID=732242 RepID=UPI002FE2B7D8
MEITDKNIVSALNKLGIEQLTDMQKSSINAFSENKDIILLSPTGSGKTIAFLLPLISILKSDIEDVQAVILAPSRELAMQINSVFKSINSQYTSVCCYGGRPTMEEHKTIKSVKPAVIIGTPGRVLDHIDKGNFSCAKVEILIIDEFDKSLEFGFHDEMKEIIENLSNLKKRILTSATDAEEIPDFTGLNSVIRLNYLDNKDDEEERLNLFVVNSPEKDKLETLYKLLCTVGEKQTVVFCNHRESVERVDKFLKSKKLITSIFHGGMEQDYREKSLYKFRNGSSHILVSTDLAARGLDIPEIENIIHYHLPTNQEGFTHRNGRTARWQSYGNSYILLGPEENLPEYIDEDINEYVIPEVLPKPGLPKFVTLYIGKGKKDKINKVDIVGFLFKKGNLSKEDIGKVDVKDHYAFAAISRKKIKQAMTLLKNEKLKGQKILIEEAK